MKYNILDYIDSDTLREMLRGKQLEPAIECILIAQSKTQSMKKKLAALQERYQIYSPADFQKGVFHLRETTDFANALNRYITEMDKYLHLTDTVCTEYIFQIQYEFALHNHTFASFAEAVSYLKSTNVDAEDCTIFRRKLYDTRELPICYHMNEQFEIAAITLYDEFDWNIEEAFAELPHEYLVGDIVQYRDDYYVLASVSRATQETRWLSRADYGDMSLYCFGYYPDKLHSCGGTYGHAHIPILQAERIRPTELPQEMKPLLAFSLLLKDEMKITDFLESYSNGMLFDLMQYYERKQA